MTEHFCYRLRVRFGECDAQRVVFNSRYGDYVDLASFEFFRALGWGEVFKNGPLDYQVVKLTLEWRASARFDDVVDVAVFARHVGNTSFTLGFEFRLAGQSPILATAECVYVMVEARSLAKTPIPDELRAVLQRGGAGLVTDHSGGG